MQSALRRTLAWHSGSLSIAVVLLYGCGGGSATEPNGPSEIVLDPASLRLTAVGETQQISSTVLDRQGNPLPDVAVSWTSADASVATVSPTGVVTAQGVGSTRLTASAGSVTARADVEVVETFHIEVQFVSSATESQRAAFADAQARWESIITGDVEDVLVDAKAGDCGEGSPAINRSVDDVLILVMVDSIDGPRNVLGSAGPCLVRVPGLLPALGVMHFDEADLDEVEAEGLLSTVVLHEMAHVLGFGIRLEPAFRGAWDTLLVDPALTLDGQLNPGADPHFTGARALTAFDLIGGSGYSGGKVPVENMAEPGQEAGTVDSHWRESVFQNELMTGFAGVGANPLSRVTVASLGDMGYVVNEAGADNFTLPPTSSSLRIAGSSRRIDLRNDILRVPIMGITKNGQAVARFNR